MHGPTEFKQGAREVIELFDLMRERAQNGDLVHVCICATTFAGSVLAKMAGDGNYQSQAFLGLSILQDEIKHFLVSRHPPTKDVTLTADYACYNIAAAPCSFDFIAWLVEREMLRVAAGAPFPLKIHFHFGPDNDKEYAFQYPRRQFMFENMVRPAITFVGAVEDEAAKGGMSAVDTYSLVPIIEMFKNGQQVPKFQTPVVANNNGPKPVVITLREAGHAPARNSNVEEWIKFAKWLQARGERVLFVRDTAMASERLEDFEICPMASTDLHARLAVYLDAKCNLFVPNGPWMLAIFTDTPWMLFHHADPQAENYESSPDAWKKYIGIEPGEQLPWSNDKQRLIWERPSFENLTTAWERMWEAPGQSPEADKGR